MDKLEYFFRLVNQMSAPARAMKTDVEKLNDAIEETQQALKDLDVQQKKTRLEKTVDPLKKQRLQLQLNQQSLREQAQALKQAETATKGYTLGADVMSGVIQQAIGAVAGLAVRTVELGIAGARFATDAIAFKEQTLTALRVMTGTEASAQRIFGQALEFAKRTPFDTRDVLGGFTQLLGAGFKENEVATVFAAIGDAAAASGFDQQVIDRMVVAFAQIKAKGRLMGQEMLQVNEALGRAGVGTTAIYDEMAKKLGKTRAEVMKLQEAGRIDSDTAIFSIIKALEQKSGGAVGNLMAQQSKTLTGLLSTLKSAPGDFFMSLDMSQLPGFDALKGFVGNLVKLFDAGSKSGRRLQEVAGRLYNTVMVGLFGDVAGDGGLASLEKLLLRVADVVDDSLPGLRNLIALLKGFGTGFASGLLASFERIAGVSKLMAGGPEAAEAARVLGEQLGRMATSVFKVAEAIFFIMQPLVWLQETLGSNALLAPASAEKQGMDWGRALTSGLTRGILENAALGPVHAIGQVVDGVTGTYKALTQTHSPSRLFAQYGAWAVEGWALGATGALPDAAGAVGALADVGGEAGVDAVPAAAPARGLGMGAPIHLTVPLQVVAGDREDADDFGRRVRDFLVRELPGALEVAFTQVAVQTGG